MNMRQEKEKHQKIGPSRAIKNPDLPRWFWAGGISGLIILAVLAGFLLSSGESSSLIFLSSKTPTITKTPLPTRTTTLTFSPTKTSIQKPTLTITTTATPGIGVSKISETDGMTQMFVPAGKFMMGYADGWDNEQPVHVVYLDAYWIDQTEVTNEMYAQFLNEMGNQMEFGVTWLAASNNDVQIMQSDVKWVVASGKKNYPVIQVNWFGAQAYCEWAGRELPTEAQWEKAARGIDNRIFPWGETVPDCSLTQYAACEEGTIEVGSLPAGASPYGVLDMAGNVWEWVADWYDRDYYNISPEENPENTNNSGGKMLRGGSWIGNYYTVHVTSRFRANPGSSSDTGGFRCVESVP